MLSLFFACWLCNNPWRKTKQKPGHGEKAGTKIQGDSVEAESSFGELEVPKTLFWLCMLETQVDGKCY